MLRRNFLLSTGVIGLASLIDKKAFAKMIDFESDDKKIFNELIDKAKKNKWNNLPIGDLTIKFAEQFAGCPYVGATLEKYDEERIVVNLREFDCVTFYESSLALARSIKYGKSDFDSFTSQLINIRYRNGKIEDYSSRLHYSSDWITDNIKRKNVEDISQLIGEKLNINVFFMSKNPNYYKQLKSNPELIKKIKETETNLNNSGLYYVKANKIKNISKNLHNGDIIAIVTDKAGLDYSHTGFIKVTDNGERHFFHASSKHKKVMLDDLIENYVASSPKNLGISVVRPI